MTAPSTPRKRQRRVSDRKLRFFCNLGSGEEREKEASDLALDLRDALATIAQRDAEIAQLRKALATARRDGWIAGRDAAAEFVAKEVDEPDDELGSIVMARWDDAPEISEAIRALAPPAVADGGRDD